MRKIAHALQLWQNMKSRYVFYRVKHEFSKKLGLLKRKHPNTLQLKRSITKAEWLAAASHFVIPSREAMKMEQRPTAALKLKAERILNGELQYFNAEWISIGKDYDWITNPINKYQYDIRKHWSEIPDLSEEAGDIKFVWEKSRFSYLLTIIRYDFHFGVDLSEFVFSEIDSWIEANPINQGPNWRCSQETSLRIFNWLYALYYYQNSRAFTEDRWKKIQNIIYASVHHVYHHINFSRIAVRNNHAITETLFLTISAPMFPFIPEAKKWTQKGRQWFEQEVDYQVYEDGTFLQFSMNYHRVLVQLFSFGLSLFDCLDQKFSEVVYQKAYKSLNFLYQCMQDENGWLPNYGSNDGALFFPLADTDYRDYRPQLNTLHRILTGAQLFSDVELNEDFCWVGTQNNSGHFQPIKKLMGVQRFDEGGYYLCRMGQLLTFIRCGSHKDRPAQADNLHLDIWYQGTNILRDSGTYKYNTDSGKLNYFMGSASHNVVMLGKHSQMLKGGRFIWYYWTQKINASWTETPTSYIFTGEISTFRFLNKSASHKRVVCIDKNELTWRVHDLLKGLDGFEAKQIWHPNDPRLKVTTEQGELQTFDSLNSNYYGTYTSEKSVYTLFHKQIETKLTFSP